MVDRDTVSACPAEPGAYALVIGTGRPVRLVVKGREFRIGPGIHVYAGSARGPGGLRARIARHFRRDKAVRWHVDRLTGVAACVAAVAVPGGRECAIAAALAAGGRFAFAAPGFGASDCRTCPGHLLAPVSGNTGGAG